MAKTRENAPDLQTQLSQAALPVETAQDGTPVVDVSALKSELERLRRENEILRRQQIAPTGLSSERGQLKTYRVSLAGMRTMLSERVVSPRLSAPPSIRLLPPKSYEDLDLFLTDGCHDPNKIVEAAWERYCKDAPEVQETLPDGSTRTYRLDPFKHKALFSVTAQVGPGREYLDIPAQSPADAFELFRIFNGITATAARPSVTPAPETPAAA